MFIANRTSCPPRSAASWARCNLFATAGPMFFQFGWDWIGCQSQAQGWSQQGQDGIPKATAQNGGFSQAPAAKSGNSLLKVGGLAALIAALVAAWWLSAGKAEDQSAAEGLGFQSCIRVQSFF